MADDYAWTCPYCRQVATITERNRSGDTHSFNRNNKVGHLGLFSHVIVCPNSDCREFTITAELYQQTHNGHGWVIENDTEPLSTWQLRPDSKANPFPEYIPAPILQDYQEACLIAKLSPKASATLSRRCLQGLIRDFWGIDKARLIDEINALVDKIDPVTWQAIDSVRRIGNIAAHMEKDINLIVDVDPQEAEMLIGLIEVLLEEWYVHRHEREQQMQKIIAAAQLKAAAKSGTGGRSSERT
jgi:hypothetical protein